jgi:hypothetical protein
MGLIIKVFEDIISLTWHYFLKNYEVVSIHEKGSLVSRILHGSAATSEGIAVFSGRRFSPNEDNALIFTPKKTKEGRGERASAVHGVNHFPSPFLDRLQQDNLTDLSGEELVNALVGYCHDLVDHGLVQRDPKEQLIYLSLATQILRNAFFELADPRSDRDRIRAICAWQIALCMEQGWSKGHFHSSLCSDLREKAVAWLEIALRHDKFYTQMQFKNSRRQRELGTLLRDNPTVWQALEDSRTSIETIDWSEITPPPKSYGHTTNTVGGDGFFAYDMNNILDLTHHLLVAEEYEREGEWLRAVDVWRRVVWLEPKRRYRCHLVFSMEKAAQQSPTSHAGLKREAQKEIERINSQYGPDHSYQNWVR